MLLRVWDALSIRTYIKLHYFFSLMDSCDFCNKASKLETEVDVQPPLPSSPNNTYNAHDAHDARSALIKTKVWFTRSLILLLKTLKDVSIKLTMYA
jgi:hypothetical protein